MICREWDIFFIQVYICLSRVMMPPMPPDEAIRRDDRDIFKIESDTLAFCRPPSSRRFQKDIDIRYFLFAPPPDTPHIFIFMSRQPPRFLPLLAFSLCDICFFFTSLFFFFAVIFMFIIQREIRYSCLWRRSRMRQKRLHAISWRRAGERR